MQWGCLCSTTTRALGLTVLGWVLAAMVQFLLRGLCSLLWDPPVLGGCAGSVGPWGAQQGHETQ